MLKASSICLIIDRSLNSLPLSYPPFHSLGHALDSTTYLSQEYLSIILRSIVGHDWPIDARPEQCRRPPAPSARDPRGSARGASPGSSPPGPSARSARLVAVANESWSPRYSIYYSSSLDLHLLLDASTLSQTLTNPHPDPHLTIPPLTLTQTPTRTRTRTRGKKKTPTQPLTLNLKPNLTRTELNL